MRKVPVLITTYNRPALFSRVFTEVLKYRPNRLYISFDGLDECRNLDFNKSIELEYQSIIESSDLGGIDLTIWRNQTNLGCRLAMQKAISKFFKKESMGIILEDDCLPNLSFFNFIEAMLHEYNHDQNVMHVSGANFQDLQTRSEASYYFSNVPHIWGWGTWRRAWLKYIPTPSAVQISLALNKLNYPRLFTEYYDFVIRKTARGEIDTWDYQWFCTIWYFGGVCITPNKNMITNIGFGENATHTKDPNSSKADLPKFELSELTSINPNKNALTNADIYYFYAHVIHSLSVAERTKKKWRFLKRRFMSSFSLRS